jgi:hypothetical protein
MSDSSTRVIRTPDQRLRVFVSSTLQEVVDERKAAREAITHLRLAPRRSKQSASAYHDLLDHGVFKLASQPVSRYH